MQMVCEVSAFSLAGLIMGRFGPDAMAAHQIAITLAATAFMIPLGLSMALTVRIGEAHGAGRLAAAASDRDFRLASGGGLFTAGARLRF